MKLPIKLVLSIFLLSISYLLLPTTSLADTTCPDDIYYRDNSPTVRACIHKHAGVADSAQPGGCRYAFDTAQESFCEGTAPTLAPCNPGFVRDDLGQCTIAPPTPTLSPKTCDPGYKLDDLGQCVVATPTPVSGNTTTPTPTPMQWTAGKQGAFTLGYPLLEGILCTTTMINPLEDCPVQVPAKDKDGNIIKDNKGRIKYILGFTNGQLGGAMGTLAGLTGTLYDHPPTSTTYYLADLGKQLRVVPEAYAQTQTQTTTIGGSGDAILSPVLAIWKTMRNFSYLMFIIVFLIVGFMIMFRQKINPQTVISVQAALPGLVVGLILVTFSYFLAALMVDLAFVGIQLVVQIFISSGAPNALGTTPQDLQNLATNSNLLDLFRSSFRFSGNSDDLSSGVTKLIQTIGNNSGVPGGGTATTIGLSGLIGLILGGLVGGILSPALLIGAGVGLATGLGGSALGFDPVAGIVSLIVPAILIIGLLVQFFRLFFKLIYAYVSILIFTILGPVIIMYSSIPGRGGAMSFWWKNILGNALVFPGVFAVFLFAGMVLGGTSANSWQAAPPLFGGLPTDLLRLIVAYAFIMGSPAIPDMIKKAVGVKDVGEIAQAAQAGFSAGLGVGRVGLNAALRRRREEATQYYRAESAQRAGTGPAPGHTARWWYRLVGNSGGGR